MNFRRGKREVPGLNTTSTADISFILLVFFLVISSMDSTKGVFKQLPPEDKAKTEEVTEMDRRNVMDISIWGEGDVRVDGKPVDVRRLQGVPDARGSDRGKPSGRHHLACGRAQRAHRPADRRGQRSRRQQPRGAGDLNLNPYKISV